MDWNETRAKTLEALGAAYLGEIEQLAEQLRPRFESGELRGTCEGDYEKEPQDVPMTSIEDAVRDHFGLQVETLENTPPGYITYRGDEAGAYLILAVSPAARAEEEDGGDFDGWNHIALAATASAAWDVVFAARRRWFYVPSSDEQPGPGQGTRLRLVPAA